jgi:hypothetical protein
LGRTAKNKSDREMAKTIALQLPDVEVSHHHNATEMRVHNRVFAKLPARTKVLAVKAAAGWQELPLEDIDPDRLRELLVEAWLFTAPPAVRALHEAKLR